MTKSLTEQWRDGTIEYGLYYVRIVGRNDITIAHTMEEDLNVEEVLAPVPSYEEYKELKDDRDYFEKTMFERNADINRLQKQLAIATKALKECYVNMNYWARMTHRDCKIFVAIKKALKEIEEVK